MRLAALSFVAALAGCAITPYAPRPPEPVIPPIRPPGIVVGESIEGIRLGDPRDEIVRRLGPPEVETPRGEMAYPSRGLVFLLNPRVVAACAVGPYYPRGRLWPGARTGVSWRPYAGLFVGFGGSLLADGDMRDWPGFSALVRRDGEAGRPAPGRRVWLLVSDDARAALGRMAAGDPATDDRRQRVLASLNALLERGDFYAGEDFAGVRTPPAAFDLLRVGLTRGNSAYVRRFNRVILEASFPAHIAKSPGLLDMRSRRPEIRALLDARADAEDRAVFDRQRPPDIDRVTSLPRKSEVEKRPGMDMVRLGEACMAVVYNGDELNRVVLFDADCGVDLVEGLPQALSSWYDHPPLDSPGEY